VNSPELTQADLAWFAPPRAQPSSPGSGGGISPSLIELPFDEGYKRLAEALVEAGARRFHIDTADGVLVPRSVSGLEKARWLRARFPRLELHAHLMVSGDALGEAVAAHAAAGCTGFALHPRAFAKTGDLLLLVDAIRKLGFRPGLVSETGRDLEGEILPLLEQTGIDWVVMLGVPAGYGGQRLAADALPRLKALRAAFPAITIEADGGLTPENAGDLRAAGADILAGWSFIAADTPEGAAARYAALTSRSP
jgi:ribulose-phosphate 3-epimerase